MLRAIYMVIVFILMLFTSFGGVGSLFILYVKDIYGLETITPIALVFTISSGVSIAAAVFIGYLYDRYGSTMGIAIVSMVLWTLTMNTMSRFSSWDKASIFWYAGGVFLGLTMSSMMISLNPTLMMLFPFRKGLAVSVPQSAQALAMTFWSYTAARLLQTLGFFNTLTVIGLTSSISIALISAILRKIGRSQGSGLGDRSNRNNFDASLTLSVKDLRIKLAVVYTMMFSIALSSVVIMAFLAGIIEESFVIAMDGFGYTNYIRTTVVPKIMVIIGFVQAVSAIVWGYTIDRLGVIKVIPIVYALETISTLGAYAMYIVKPWIVVGFIMLRYLFFAAEPIAHWVLIPTVFGTRSLGRISGIVNSAPMLASLMAPVLAGSIKDAIGSYSYILLISSILSTVSLAVYLYLRKIYIEIDLPKGIKPRC